ncbi:MAG: DNA-directed RNA polymerase subunit M [Candidatus Thorarchaeota archaeon]|nr:DNA-directed RNA polymerase subunit M [Candidatus Thorarchaeota archaeon]
MILEFCEKCGAMMLPTKKEDGSRVLKCRECGHEKPLTKTAEDYRVKYRIDHSPREKIVVIEDEDRSTEEMTEDERRERRKAILEFLQLEDGD